MLAGLVELAAARDGNTGQHLQRIRFYTGVLVGALNRRGANISEQDAACIVAASSLHDIGKVGISDPVLHCTGDFNADQRLQMQRHPLVGADILLSLSEHLGRDPWIDTAIKVTIGHHERWDGSGYPFGLRGSLITLPARIVALADVYDALTTRRPYKAAMSHEAAAAIIERAAGTQFDPEVVAAFVDSHEAFARVASRLGD